jgi:preprotein translocase subunit SecD
MRTPLIIVFLVIARSLALCAETNALSFFVVSDTAIPGGRYIDTAEFPKLGYISNAPSYVLTRLREVSTNDVTEISIMDRTSVSTNTSPAVDIRMFRTDGESFAEFTRQNIDRKVLLMLRDKPLLAPMVRAPIETGSIQLPSLPKSVVEDIQKLVRYE